MASAVLDSSALLALINGEPGAGRVTSIVDDAAISTVNVAETVSKLVERGASLEVARTVLDVFDFETVDFDRALADATGALVARTKQRRLSLGDRACISLAEARALPVFTADRSWMDVDLDCPVRLIR